MKIRLSDSSLRVELNLLEKVLALHGDVVVPRAQIIDVNVDPRPLRSTLRSGIKMGLRLPGVIFLCTDLRRRRFWAVKRHQEAIHVVYEDRVRRELTVCADDARRLAAVLAP